MRNLVIGIIGIMLILVISICGAATNGTVTKVLSEGEFIVYKYTLAAAVATSSETFTFPFTGMVYKVVVVADDTDADGDMTISDISGVNYLSWANFLAASSRVSYVLQSTDIDGNSYGGVPVAGTNTVTLTNLDNDASPLTIYIYCKVK